MKLYLFILLLLVPFHSGLTQCEIENSLVNLEISSKVTPKVYRIQDTVGIGKEPCPTITYKTNGLLSSNSTLNDHWYYFKLSNQSLGKDLIVELDNSQTDNVDFYTINAGNVNLELAAGDQIAFTERKIPHRNIIFEIPDALPAYTLLINVKNRGSYSIPVRVFVKDYFDWMDSRRTLILGMYIGLVIIFIIFVIVGLILARYLTTYLYYLLYLIFAGLYFFSELGFSDIYLWPNNPKLEEPFLFIFILGSSVSFLFLVRNLFKVSPKEKNHKYFLIVLLGLVTLCLMCVVFGFIQNNQVFVIVYNLILLIVGIIFLYALIIGLYAVKQGVSYSKYFLLAFSAMIIGIILKPASLFGLIPYTSTVHYAGVIGQGFEIISLSTLLVLEFFNRTRYAAGLETEVLRLERSALQAQMNPHFIFNSLNSIQNYIAKNEKVQAMDFLAKFAKLVRITLNASSSKKITLSKEIDLLRNYMELEKMRFKDKFEFIIEIDSNIDSEEIEIPPLMVQPFVENAIIHGFKGIKQKGLIILRFQLRDNQLEVCVEDNGTGIQQSSTKKTHKSMAISITKQRLSHLNRISNDKDLVIQGKENGQGTIVRINFDLGDQDE